MKANPDTVVLRLLAALGTGFDCASINEIKMVAGLGVNPDRVIFANPCKPTSFVKHAAKLGVDMTTFDNVDELYKISRTHPGAKLVLRILTDDSKSLCRLGLKFGASLVAVPTLLAKAVELGLNVVGISFHVGSGCYDTDAFADAVARAKKAFIMGQEAGYHFTLLDVGGGFESEHFEESAAVLARALRTHFGDFSGRFIAEPGRFYVADAFTLATNIIARRGPEHSILEQEADEDSPRVMCRFHICISRIPPRHVTTLILICTDKRLTKKPRRLSQRWGLQLIQLHPIRSPDSVTVLPHRWQGARGRSYSGTPGDKQLVGPDMRFDRLCNGPGKTPGRFESGRLAGIPEDGGLHHLRRVVLQRL